MAIVSEQLDRFFTEKMKEYPTQRSFLVPMLRCSGKDCGRLWHGTLLQPCPACRSPLLGLPISVVHTVSPTMRKLPDNADDGHAHPWRHDHPWAALPLLDRFGAYGRLQRSLPELRKAALAAAALRTLTLDPANDTPAVLKEYAAVRGIDTKNFSFLTGPESAIKDLLTQFGVAAQPNDTNLAHTLSTVLIDPAGKIAHREDGSAWEPKDFVARMKRG